MRAKIFRTTIAITLITLCASMSTVIGMIYNLFENSDSSELRREADHIADTLEIYGMDYITSVDFVDLRVSYINSEGTVLYDNKAQTKDMENHSTREEFIQAIETGEGQSARLSKTLSEKTYYISKRLSNGDVLRISDTRASEWSLVIKVVYRIIFVLVLSLMLSAIFSRRLAARVTKPINEIDLSNPDKADVYEELTPLLTRIAEQRKQIDNQMSLLKKERREFAAITSNMKEGFIVIDSTTNILSSNSAAADLLNCGEIVPEGSVFQLNRSEKFMKAVESALDGVHVDVILEENSRYISVFANPVYEKKKLIGALLILMDVTEKEGRESLRREFTGNVSHELKTPLTSISVAAEMLKSGMVKSEDTKSFTEKIYNEAKRLINLVDDIIKLSRLDEGESKIAFVKTDCAIPVKKAVNELWEAAEKKNIELTAEIESIEMDCIPHLVEELVYNLLSNAIKYTPEGGKVNVRFENRDGVVLSVSDTGIGIPKSEQERIFERFYRVDRSHTKTIEGTGLGLSIVKHAALIHNALVKVESEEGKGSTFKVIF